MTCIWRGVKNLNIENDSYRSPIDHSRDPELGIIQTRGRVINRKWWNIPVEYEHGKEFDNLVFYCVDKGFRNIIRIYIIPRKEIENRNSVSITNDSLPRWYDEYRVDEEIVKKVNKIFHSII